MEYNDKEQNSKSKLENVKNVKQLFLSENMIKNNKNSKGPSNTMTP